MKEGEAILELRQCYEKGRECGGIKVNKRRNEIELIDSVRETELEVYNMHCINPDALPI